MGDLDTQYPLKKVLLVDAESLVASLIAEVVGALDGYQVVAFATSVGQACKILEETKDIDIVISEIELPQISGLELVREIARKKYAVRVMILSRVGSLDVVRQAITAGAQGYITKMDSLQDLLNGLRSLETSRRVLSSSLAQIVDFPANYFEIEAEREAFDPLRDLSPREREIFHLLAAGLRNSTIAKKLFISPRTVETHRARIVRKLQISSNGELIRYAIKHGLVSL